MSYNVEIAVAETAGFCNGIKRAREIALSAAKEYGRAYTLGKLAHNDDFLKLLEAENVFKVESVREFIENAEFRSFPLVIRSHGIGKAIYKELIENEINFKDATCPYVSKIHEIVEASGNTGNKRIIILGDKFHPEIIGIIGHINGEYNVVNSSEELISPEFEADLGTSKLVLVAQTTFNKSDRDKCADVLKARYKDAEIFDTICNATVKRQEEAERLSKESDLMVSIGSSDSANSKKLFEICSKNCKDAFFIENAKDLRTRISEINGIVMALLSDQRINNSKNDYYGIKNPKNDVKIGVTAGASVPAEIIKEVRILMKEEVKIPENEIDFMAEVDKTFQKLYIGKKVKACVVAVNKTEAVVDLGTKHSGYIPADEIGGNPGDTPDMVVKPDDEIECIVTSVSDIDGIVWLSKKKVDSLHGLERISAAYNEGGVLEGYVSGVVNGGVIITFEGQRVFIPASHSGVPKSGKLEELLKRTVKFKIIELDEARAKVVGSIKLASRGISDEAKAKFWAEIEIGKKFVGEIKSIESYGVFVDLGGVDGMVHLSELTWKRIRHPKEMFNVGDKINVVVKNYDLDKKRVSLSAKNPDENPWTKFVADYKVGDVVKATVVNIAPFGAFARIIPGIDGLIHISQLSADKIKNVSDVVQIDQEIEAEITEIEPDRERVSLSMRALDSEQLTVDG